MLLITAVLVTLTALVIIPVMRVPGGVKAAKLELGWMSQRWLAEHRAAHP